MNYHNITTADMRNGDGLRTVLWVAGCEHHCDGCHNPITWDVNGGEEFTVSVLAELLYSLEPSWCSGLTLSGGDPLHPANRDAVCAICNIVKTLYPNKTIWCYTGYNWDEIKDLPVIQVIDVLVDNKFDKTLADVSYCWAGSTNQRVIDVKATLHAGELILHGRRA